MKAVGQMEPRAIGRVLLTQISCLSISFPNTSHYLWWPGQYRQNHVGILAQQMKAFIPAFWSAEKAKSRIERRSTLGRVSFDVASLADQTPPCYHRKPGWQRQKTHWYPGWVRKRACIPAFWLVEKAKSRTGRFRAFGIVSFGKARLAKHFFSLTPLYCSKRQKCVSSLTQQETACIPAWKQKVTEKWTNTAKSS